MHAVVAAIKSFFCCTLAGAVRDSWLALTFSGLLSLFALAGALHLLSRLDQLPPAGCCGAHTYRRYHGAKYRDWRLPRSVQDLRGLFSQPPRAQFMSDSDKPAGGVGHAALSPSAPPLHGAASWPALPQQDAGATPAFYNAISPSTGVSVDFGAAAEEERAA